MDASTVATIVVVFGVFEALGIVLALLVWGVLE